MKEEVHVNLVAMFYSNMHFANRHSFVFTICGQNHVVNLDELAEIIQIEYYIFKLIPVKLDRAYNFVLEMPNFARSFRKIILLSLLHFKMNFIQKMLTLSLC